MTFDKQGAPPPIGATPLKGSRLSLLGALSLRSGT